MEFLWTIGGLCLTVGVYPELEDQEPGNRHQATGRNRRQEDAAEVKPTESRSRKRWMKGENKEIRMCYSMSDPAMSRYRKIMHNIWNERSNVPKTEQRLADQIHGIMKNNWLCDRKRKNRKKTSP